MVASSTAIITLVSQSPNNSATTVTSTYFDEELRVQQATDSFGRNEFRGTLTLLTGELKDDAKK